MISDLVRDVLRGQKNVSMSDGDRSSSSCVAKDVDRKIANVKTLDPVNSASKMGESA